MSPNTRHRIIGALMLSVTIIVFPSLIYLHEILSVQVYPNMTTLISTAISAFLCIIALVCSLYSGAIIFGLCKSPFRFGHS